MYFKFIQGTPFTYPEDVYLKALNIQKLNKAPINAENNSKFREIIENYFDSFLSIKNLYDSGIS